MHHRTVEIGEPVDGRISRFPQDAGSRDQKIDDKDIALIGPHPPPAVLEPGLGDRGTEPNPSAKIELGGETPEILPDFTPWREEPGPVRLRRKGELVKTRRDITAQAGVGVVSPGAADLIRLLQNGDIGNARLVQHRRHTQTGHACSDDRNRG